MTFQLELERVAAVARQQTKVRARAAYRAVGHASVDKDEFETISRSAAYIAFITLGGDAENDATIPARNVWVRETVQNVVHDLEGKHSDAWEFRTRLRGRRTAREIDQFQWDAWKLANGVSRDDGVPFPTEISESPCLQQELEYSATVLQEELLRDLTDILSAGELYLFVEHYIKGRSMRELGVELVGNCGTKEDEDRAKQKVNSMLRRGRVRAAQQLGPRWRVVASEASL